MRLRDRDDANVIAALMNGDLATLGNAIPEMLAHCYDTIQIMLRVPRQQGMPAVGSEAFLLH